MLKISFKTDAMLEFPFQGFQTCKMLTGARKKPKKHTRPNGDNEQTYTNSVICTVRQFSTKNSNSDCSFCGDMPDLAGSCRNGKKRPSDPDIAWKSWILNNPTADSARYSDSVPRMCYLSASFPFFRQKNCDNHPNFQYLMSENFKWCLDPENSQNSCLSR